MFALYEKCDINRLTDFVIPVFSIRVSSLQLDKIKAYSFPNFSLHHLVGLPIKLNFQSLLPKVVVGTLLYFLPKITG